MNITTGAKIRSTIDAADTPAKVWALVAALVDDANGYGAETYLTNVRGYATLALEETEMDRVTWYATSGGEMVARLWTPSGRSRRIGAARARELIASGHAVEY